MFESPYLHYCPSPANAVRTDLTLKINRKGELSAKMIETRSQEGHGVTAETTIVRPKHFNEDAIVEMKAEFGK